MKGGKTGVKDMRDLRGVLDGEKAATGVLRSLQSPTRDLAAEAVSAGFYEPRNVSPARIRPVPWSFQTATP